MKSSPYTSAQKVVCFSSMFCFAFRAIVSKEKKSHIMYNSCTYYNRVTFLKSNLY